MKRALDEDLRITLTHLDTEQKAAETLLEEKIEDCRSLTQELDKELSNPGAQVRLPGDQVTTGALFISSGFMQRIRCNTILIFT